MDGTLQIAVAVIGALGGLGGVAAGLGVFLQRRKFKAEAADVLTDTALTLVEPLKQRLKEVEAEATATRTDLRKLREELSDLHSLVRRWKRAILNVDDVSRDDLIGMVGHDSAPGNNRP